MKAVCRICGKSFEPDRNQLLCGPVCKAIRKAEWMKAYMRGYKPKPKAKTEGYSREPGIRADRFIDQSRPLPSEDVILHYWSHWDILVELSRL